MSSRAYLIAGIGALIIVAAAAGYFLMRPVTVQIPAAELVIALQPDDAALVAEGRDIYFENCASCHGANLEGQSSWRNRNANGRLPAPPHDQSGHTWHHPDTVLFDLTKFGPASMIGQGYESDMPGYEGTLSDAEIIAVLSFIKSTWPEEIRARHDGINMRGGH